MSKFRCYNAPTAGDALNSAAAIKSQIFTRGPVVAFVSVFSDFEDYAGGTYFAPQGASAVRLVLMMLVGWDVDLNGN